MTSSQGQAGIQITQLLEREYRNLDRIVVAFRMQTGAAAHVLQLFTEHAAGSQIDHRHAGDLGDVRYGTGRTRVYLDNVDLIVVQNELDVDQTENSEVLCLEPRCT